MTRAGYEWSITKSGAPTNIKKIGKDDYAFHERASTVYTHYISGYAEEEIVKFLRAGGAECTVEDIELDIQHIQSLLPTRTLISHENDRARLLLQRSEGKKYRSLLSEALDIKAAKYISAGMSPAGALKEYREAVGMTEKPGGISVHVDQRSLHVGAGAANGVSSSEDLLRRVMSKLKAQEIPPVDAIEAEATEVAPADEVFDDGEDESIPDPDD
jgi:hypothetical protein